MWKYYTVFSDLKISKTKKFFLLYNKQTNHHKKTSYGKYFHFLLKMKSHLFAHLHSQLLTDKKVSPWNNILCNQ